MKEGSIAATIGRGVERDRVARIGRVVAGAVLGHGADRVVARLERQASTDEHVVPDLRHRTRSSTDSSLVEGAQLSSVEPPPSRARWLPSCSERRRWSSEPSST